MSTVIDGYNIELEISDVDANDTVEIEVDSISHEDAGIGSYEYWGEVGYDSRPYVEVGGYYCGLRMSLAFLVDPVDTVYEDESEEI